MPLWRHFPPVHGALPRGATAAALAALTDAGAAEARDRATDAIASRYPGRAIQLLDSGTSALTLALAGTRRAGDRPVVALPAYACPDVGAAALGAGFNIRLYDVEPDTLQPDLDSLQAALAAGASHVVCTHLFGRLADVAAITPLAAAHGAVLIEDAAQHAGGTLRGVRGGALAPLSILSFGRGKGINAGGGGALLCKPEPAITARAVTGKAPSVMKILCSALLVDRLSSPWLYRIPTLIPSLRLGETRYHAPQPPAGISGVSASFVSLAFNAEASSLRERRAAEAEYDEALREVPGMPCTLHPDGVSGALRYPVRLSPAPVAGLEGLGVARSYPRTLAAYPELRGAMLGCTHWPGAEELAAHLHTLPTHALLRAHERRALITLLLQSAR